MKKWLLMLALVFFAGCSQQEATESVSLAPDAVTGRWYSQERKEAGLALFRRHCATCHGENAEAIPDWKKPDADGNYPPPPLNGSAHAWHHPLKLLHKIIAQGGAPYGGKMPGWEGSLSEQEMLSVIAGFQSFWPDEIYQHWLQIEKNSRAL